MIPSKPQYALINSFPRSGSTFLHSALDKHDAEFTFVEQDEDYIDKFCEWHAASLPYIIENEKIKTISILRDPYDAIASIIYYKYRYIGMQEFRDTDIKFYVSMYLEFTDAIQKMHGTDNFIAIDFNEMIEHPSAVCERIINKFNLYRPKITKIPDDALLVLVKEQMIANNQVSSGFGENVPISFMPEKSNPLRNSVSALVKESKKDIDPAFKAYKKVLKLIS